MDDSVEHETTDVFLDFVDHLAANKGIDRNGALELMKTMKPKKLAKKRESSTSNKSSLVPFPACLLFFSMV